MPDYKRILVSLRGGMSQNKVAAALHASKRDVSSASTVLRESGLTLEQIEAMDEDEIVAVYFPKSGRGPSTGYLQPDIAALIRRKMGNRGLTVKFFWIEYCADAEGRGLKAYSYQTFAKKFSDEAGRRGVTMHFEHEPAEKAYIDWAGDTARVVDEETGEIATVYLLVVVLPFSGKLWAEGFLDMRQPEWQAGQMHAFESFGGVPRLLVPDNAKTATVRTDDWGLTLLNEEYDRFAEHYGSAVLPARVRKPRDKPHAESTVRLVEQWVIAPSLERTFRSLGEFNEFCAEKVSWLNSRELTGRRVSRDQVFESEELPHMLPLPPSRYEPCDWVRRKVAADYHISFERNRYSVPYTLYGEVVDVRVTPTRVTVMHGGRVVAEHPRLRGNVTKYSTLEEHMPESHRAVGDSPWTEERFHRWADGIGPETGVAIRRLLSSYKNPTQAFYAARNILGLAKRYSGELLERACAMTNALSYRPSYTSVKNTIEGLRAKDGAAAAEVTPASDADKGGEVGRTRGADEFRRRTR